MRATRPRSSVSPPLPSGLLTEQQVAMSMRFRGLLKLFCPVASW